MGEVHGSTLADASHVIYTTPQWRLPVAMLNELDATGTSLMLGF